MKYRQTPSAGYLPSGSVVAERIAEIYPSLSDALRAFADFVLNEPMKVAQMSINETVDASGVSVATANRFARKLGFDGYSQFRSELIRGFEPLLAPVERIKRTISAESPIHSVVAATIEEDLGNLRKRCAISILRASPRLLTSCRKRSGFSSSPSTTRPRSPAFSRIAWRLPARMSGRSRMAVAGFQRHGTCHVSGATTSQSRSPFHSTCATQWSSRRR